MITTIQNKQIKQIMKLKKITLCNFFFQLQNTLISSIILLEGEKEFYEF